MICRRCSVPSRAGTMKGSCKRRVYVSIVVRTLRARLSSNDSRACHTVEAERGAALYEFPESAQRSEFISRVEPFFVFCNHQRHRPDYAGRLQRAQSFRVGILHMVGRIEIHDIGSEMFADMFADMLAFYAPAGASPFLVKNLVPACDPKAFEIVAN